MRSNFIIDNDTLSMYHPWFSGTWISCKDVTYLRWNHNNETEHVVLFSYLDPYTIFHNNSKVRFLGVGTIVTVYNSGLYKTQ